ncbi:MAG: hypothetical protein QF796_01260 [Acidimicrobiales bacterium]|nr:hypothetical protein [Acidimicrobiales bacterium]MDP6648745.1 hypothetical protein [Acidimicrobiales bacterium]MDP6759667.1 hypothetical protein [Acidimicrobiales bacterium]
MLLDEMFGLARIVVGDGVRIQQPAACSITSAVATTEEDRLIHMPWIFHVDHGTGKVLSREGPSVRAEFSGGVRSLSDGYREVPDGSSWVLAGHDPERLLQLLNEDPEWIIREQHEDTYGEVTIADIANHLSLIGLTEEDVAEWRNLISASTESTEAPLPNVIEENRAFPPADESPKALRTKLLQVLEKLADPHSTDEERLLSIRRLELLVRRTPVDAGDAVVARIVGGGDFPDDTPLPKIKLKGIGKQFFANLINRCDCARDVATLGLISGTNNQAKLAIEAVADEDRDSLEEFFVELIEDAANYLCLDKRPEGAPTDRDIRRMLDRVVRMRGSFPRSLVAAMLRLRATATRTDAKAMAKAVDGLIDDIHPTVEVLKSAAEDTSDLPAELRTACLNTLPFEPTSARVLYLEALLDVSGPDLLDTKEPWEKITTRELASGWAKDHPVPTAMIRSNCGRKAATSAIRKDVDRMDSEQLGLLLALRPDIRALIPDDLFVKALERLGKRNPNVARLPELLAQPFIEEAREELQQQQSALENRQREIEAEFGRQVAARDSQVAELKKELEQARSRIASHTDKVRGALDAQLRQASIDTLKSCAEMVTNLQQQEGNEEIIELLETALMEVGIKLLDRPGEIVTFDSGRHERLNDRASSPHVEVVLSTIGFAEGPEVTVILKGIVREVA